MIAAFSASSPLVSVALIDPKSGRMVSREATLRTNASGFLLQNLRECLSEMGVEISAIDIYAADTGPGSFIGARVGVTVAKTLAFTQGKLCAGAPSFDLVAVDRTVFVPNRRGEWFVRRAGSEPVRTEAVSEDAVGYGIPDREETFPHASRFLGLNFVPVQPEELLPTYLVEPSISTPKVPYAEAPK